jgi:hypothetical protein
MLDFIWPTPPFLGTMVLMVVLDLNKSFPMWDNGGLASIAGIDFDYRLLRLIFFGVSLDGLCRAQEWDSRILKHSSFRHFMGELWMDVVCISWTSSVDCAYIVIPMRMCNMFSECSSSGPWHNAIKFCVWGCVQCVNFKCWLLWLTFSLECRYRAWKWDSWRLWHSSFWQFMDD